MTKSYFEGFQFIQTIYMKIVILNEEQKYTFLSLCVQNTAKFDVKTIKLMVNFRK